MRPMMIRMVLGFCLALPNLVWGQSAISLVQDYATKRVKQMGLTPEDIENLQLTDEYVTTHNGVQHVYAVQSHQGIPVHGARLNANILRGQVMSIHHSFIANVKNRVNLTQPSISQQQAIAAAMIALGIDAQTPSAFPGQVQGATLKQEFDGTGVSLNPISVELNYHKVSAIEARLAWNFQIYELSADNWWDLWVDATDGTILARENWVTKCQFESSFNAEGQMEMTCTHAHHHHVLSPMGALAGAYRAYPVGVESPNHGGRTLMNDPDDMVASPFGWHDTDGNVGPEYTITRGNNVYAYDDWNNDNAPGYSPDGGASLTFDFPFDQTLNPDSNRDAAITNLFVWNNFMHDVTYHYGFDEAAGNFQETNYNGEGTGGDPVNAEGFDGSGFNNANFATPPDGSNPRMQMYIWTNSTGSGPLRVNTPSMLAGFYNAAAASFGPPLPTTPLTGDLALVQDINGTTEGCDSITNQSSLVGKIAVIDRGGCSFVEKVEAAQAAGAIAVIVINNNNFAFPMPGTSSIVTIPSLMIAQNDGIAIKQQIILGVNVTIQAPSIPNGRDSNVDNGVVAHEYGHGISNRLTGGPSAAGCLSNEEQVGEGWSDFFSLIMTHEPGDQGATARGIGTFAFGQPITGGGIRPYPYSTDMNINPVTYEYIKTLSVPHGVGSVFCSMAWDLYWALVDQYGYDPDVYFGTGGNNIAIQLVMDGMKLQPCGPGFVDVRDAILLADQINNGGENQCLIWKVFARRGLGLSADQGNPDDRSDGVEAFDLPEQCRPIVTISKTVEPQVAEPGDTLTYFINIGNQKEIPATGLFLLDTLAPNLTFVQGSSDCGAAAADSVVFIQIANVNAGEEALCSFQVVVDSAHPFTSIALQDGFEDPTLPYVLNSTLGLNTWKLDQTNPRSGTNAFSVANTTTFNDQSLELPPIQLDSNQQFTFWHSFDTEAGFDGGFVEIRDAFSATWTDLGDYFIENGYTDSLALNQAVGGRRAFSGNSNGYIRSKVNLSDWAGQTVFIRFRFQSDDNGGATGWFVDDVNVGREVIVYNTVRGTSGQGDIFFGTTPIGTQIFEGTGGATALTPKLARLDIQVYPNPTHGNLSLDLTGVEHGELSIELFNLIGQQAYANSLLAGQKHEISLGDLAPGVYLLEVRNAEGIYREKLLIE
ncbi:T9SS-dependent M36 family metallopeptidase [Pontibacter sp. G13]|uniref:T9SS-dependent M36 family metallopeptidase n=1 Tax=Pontibacter sp. G13 TaxID=3074898 RepID=UPI00288BB897|nr:T9SS-dependent M36 family metallopeptidase [Pontibacter sp. G13]WNJ19183.1 T9SS-dependent M36 family metallopeptidase [Pontibacter sp. G13]